MIGGSARIRERRRPGLMNAERQSDRTMAQAIARPDVIESRSPPSCPRLSRASTPFLWRFSKQDVGGRDKPGHDSGEMVRHDSNLANAITDVAPPPTHDLRRWAQPMRFGMTLPGPANLPVPEDEFPVRTKNFPCSDNSGNWAASD